MTPQQEYIAALAAYTAAKERLIEAKRHYDHKSAPEVIASRRAKAAEYRAKRRAAQNTPERRAERERQREENKQWWQRLANIGQQAIERSENMPHELRIVGDNLDAV